MRRPPPVIVAFFILSPLVIGGLLVLAVVSVLQSPWSNEPGRALADRLRSAGSPLIESVEFHPQTIIDPPLVDVIVRPGVTEGEAAVLWCDVVVPAGGSKYEGDVGADILDSDENWLAGDADCP